MPSDWVSAASQTLEIRGHEDERVENVRTKKNETKYKKHRVHGMRLLLFLPFR
jgi:hypothetical protein